MDFYHPNITLGTLVIGPAGTGMTNLKMNLSTLLEPTVKMHQSLDEFKRMFTELGFDVDEETLNELYLELALRDIETGSS